MMKWKRHRDGRLQLGALLLTPVNTPTVISPPNIPVVINTIRTVNVYYANYMPPYKAMLMLMDDCFTGFVYLNKYSMKSFMGEFGRWFEYRSVIDMDYWRISVEGDVLLIEGKRITTPSPPETIQERKLIVV